MYHVHWILGAEHNFCVVPQETSYLGTRVAYELAKPDWGVYRQDIDQPMSDPVAGQLLVEFDGNRHCDAHGVAVAFAMSVANAEKERSTPLRTDRSVSQVEKHLHHCGNAQHELERALHRVSHLEAELDCVRASLSRSMAAGSAKGAASLKSLVRALKPFALAWESRRPAPCVNKHAYRRRLERALLGFYSVTTDSGKRYELTGHHLQTAFDALMQIEENGQGVPRAGPASSSLAT